MSAPRSPTKNIEEQVPITLPTMATEISPRSSRPVAIWLLVGIGMIMIQVVLGGITRLTGSGLSITEWKPIMGALPPMNETDWNIAFEKYRQIGQYKYLNPHFTLRDFKFIFYWEWVHRLWARLIGIAFLIPFIVFLIQKRFRKEMIRPMIILFLLGALQGLVGWIMVQSGLEDSEALYVSHYKLAIHFILALGLLCYVFWFALDLLVPGVQQFRNPGIRNGALGLLILLVLQLIYGAFMAGLKAAMTAPTWPAINGKWFPSDVHNFGNRHFNGLSFLFDHPIVVQFIHRNLAYLLTIFICIWWWKSLQGNASTLFRKIVNLPLLIVFLQLILGILTVIQPTNPSAFLWLAAAHQLVAMLLLLSLVWILFIVRQGNNQYFY